MSERPQLSHGLYILGIRDRSECLIWRGRPQKAKEDPGKRGNRDDAAEYEGKSARALRGNAQDAELMRQGARRYIQRKEKHDQHAKTPARRKPLLQVVVRLAHDLS